MSRLITNSTSDLQQRLHACKYRLKHLELIIAPNLLTVIEIDNLNIEIKKIKAMLMLRGEQIS